MSSIHYSWYLSGLNEEYKDQVIILMGEEIKLGRTEQNDVVLAQNNISRHHASIFVGPKACHIQDMGSRNGTFVNGTRIDPAAPKKIAIQDELRIGQYLFVVGKKAPKNTGYAVTAEKILQAKKKIESFSKEWSKELRIKSEKLRSKDFFSSKQKKSIKLPEIKLSKRFVLYSLMILVLAWAAYSSQSKDSTPSSKSVESQKETSLANSTSISTNPNTKSYPAAKRSDIDSIMERALSYVQFKDYAAAIPLLQSVLATESENEKARLLLDRCKKRLLETIEHHRENGAREYEKLYYDRAIIEWKKAYSLAVDFDSTIASQIETLIQDAQDKLKNN
ncbi:MAG: FHA domain-containing protein [Bdellovibrionales bacterium]|nr:FHA domain-containing protein [Bdellovibrionales bacterium]